MKKPRSTKAQQRRDQILTDLLTGVELIRLERERQIAVKGWTLDHDDAHVDGSLRVVAAVCACDGTDAYVEDPKERHWGILHRHGINGKDPNRIHVLAIAGALIAAEIDRLRRADHKRFKRISRLH